MDTYKSIEEQLKHDRSALFCLLDEHLDWDELIPGTFYTAFYMCFSYKMRDYCGFDKVPDAAKLTRFKQEFCGHIRGVFERLVESAEPICRKMDQALADILVYDTAGIESYVTENNPKHAQMKAQQAKAYVRTNPTFNASFGKTAFMPDFADSNAATKQQYINGHFCHVQKVEVVANGMGVVRHLEIFDEQFTQARPEM